MKKINLEDYRGAIVILENYLDGAVSDYEYDTVDNDSLIWDSIRTIKLLYSLVNPILLLGGNEYEERMLKAKSNRNIVEQEN